MSYSRNGNKLIEMIGNRTRQLDLNNPEVRERFFKNPETKRLVSEFQVEAGLTNPMSSRKPPAPPIRKAGAKLQNVQPQMTQATPVKRRIIGAHAQDIVGDRSYGENEELEFIKLLQEAGFVGNKANEGVVTNVGGKRLILPDTRSNNTYFENKIKYPTRGGLFGLEQYRYDSLRNLMENEGFEDIYYVINPNVRPGHSRESDALTNIQNAGLVPGQRIIAHMADLVPDKTFDSTTYRAGRAVQEPTHYFHANRFNTLNLNSLLG